MQSADGAVYLLPAIPGQWANGTVKGLRARGGFEIVDMEWKDSKMVKLVIKSGLGGNLRLRLPNEMKLNTGLTLKKATGENTNPFYQLDETPAPLVSQKARIVSQQLKPTVLYDLPTQAGRIYILVAMVPGAGS